MKEDEEKVHNRELDSLYNHFNSKADGNNDDEEVLRLKMESEMNQKLDEYRKHLK